MKQQAKRLYEKMVDFKRFAIILLAVGVFFFLGVIVPAEKTDMALNIMILASLSFLALSILFFTISKQCQIRLMDMDEDHDFFSQG
ncbi:YrhC family protein [Neobacillus dielmonensis]|uniref:YrhC family protein n=1 Tax=Neobacillus dielmonensis TaxID=1347369 RepID=UPI0005A7D1DE|nr:YrhC family protein [Neobacillus dielmonensis]